VLMVVSETNSHSISHTRLGLGAEAVSQPTIHYHRTQKILNKVEQAIRRTRAGNQPNIPSRLNEDTESSDEEEDSRVKSIDTHSKRKKEVGTIIFIVISGYRICFPFMQFSFSSDSTPTRVTKTSRKKAQTAIMNSPGRYPFFSSIPMKRIFEGDVKKKTLPTILQVYFFFYRMGRIYGVKFGCFSWWTSIT
jgi:hypothetical protein